MDTKCKFRNILGSFFKRKNIAGSTIYFSLNSVKLKQERITQNIKQTYNIKMHLHIMTKL